MNQTLSSNARPIETALPPATSGFKVDISRGERIGRVSSEWFSRPDDERYLSLITLQAAVRRRAEQSTARTVETRTVRVEADRDDAERYRKVSRRARLPHQASQHGAGVVLRRAAFGFGQQRRVQLLPRIDQAGISEVRAGLIAGFRIKASASASADSSKPPRDA